MWTSSLKPGSTRTSILSSVTPHRRRSSAASGRRPSRRKIPRRRAHVDVAHGADDALGHLKKSLRPHQHAAGRPLDVPGNAQRNVKPQRDGVRVSQFHLVEIAARAENAQIGDDPAARADQREGFLGGKLPSLARLSARRRSRMRAGPFARLRWTCRRRSRRPRPFLRTARMRSSWPCVLAGTAGRT